MCPDWKICEDNADDPWGVCLEHPHSLRLELIRKMSVPFCYQCLRLSDQRLCIGTGQVHTPARFKQIKRWKHEGVLDAMQARLERMPDAMKIRRRTSEHPFGTIKDRMGAMHVLTRTPPKDKTEMSLQVLAYNLKRMINIFGVGPLIRAIT